MIERYSLPEMASLWTEQNRFQTMLDVEIAACDAMAEEGLIPKKSAATIRKKAKFSVKEIHEIEKVTKHDVTAFLKSVGKAVGKDARFIHKGLTSSDILDTALSMQIVQAMDLILGKARQLHQILKQKSLKHQWTVTMGRTHGIHAEPTTFGLRLLLYYQEIGRDITRLEAARKNIQFGKLSGAVGTHASFSPQLERRTLKKLKLNAAPVATQVLQRDRHAEVMAALAILAASMEKISTEIRHLQRTEVREIEEIFTKGQTGSSAMPHKKNPVNCERITGLARLVRSNLLASMENIALWHERDISHSSVERVIIPDTFITVDFMLSEMMKVLTLMRVYDKQMIKTIERNRGLVFSQRLLLALIDKGMSRFDAYAIAQELAMEVWNHDESTMRGLAEKDARIRKKFSAKELDAVFDLNAYLKYVPEIYRKAGLKPKARRRK
ncbi:MAG: adenylosuccinate lyase [Candidatus Omnitrophica bacterium]|nr:adenylosuccinate lyase [Candidatus Omnitrophota bacterium]